MRPSSFALAAMILLLPGAASAQDAESAAALQEALRAWFAAWPGRAADAAPLPVRVVAADDHYTLDLALTAGSGHSPVSLDAMLRPSEGGRWALNSIHLSPGTIEMTLPPAPDKSADAGPTHVSLALEGQTGRAEIDPSFVTPSSLWLAADRITAELANDLGHQSESVEAYRLQTSIVPTPDGRLDAEQATASGPWHVTLQMRHGENIEVAGDGMHGTARLVAVSREAMALLADTALAELPSEPSAGPNPDPAATASLRTALRTMVEALHGGLTSLQSDGTMDGIHITTTAGRFGVRQVRSSMQGAAPGDRLDVGWELALEGITAPDVPPDMAVLIPSEVTVRPRLSGFDTGMLTRLAIAATAETPDPGQVAQAANALMNSPAAKFALDSLSVTLGPARLEGSAQVHLTGPGEPEVTAHLAATGLDALMAVASGKPTAQRMMPFLLMLRGMGRPDGGRLVWDVVASQRHVLVNGIDLQMLAGGVQKAPAGAVPQIGRLKPGG